MACAVAGLVGPLSGGSSGKLARYDAVGTLWYGLVQNASCIVALCTNLDEVTNYYFVVRAFVVLSVHTMWSTLRIRRATSRARMCTRTHTNGASVCRPAAIGAFTIRSAGCTVNDMWDRDFDGKVARTAQRPLASGKLSQFNALCFLGAQLAVGLGVLVNLNWPTIQLGIAAVPLVVVYPLMKRVTHYPQVVLGLAMNYGVLMGWAAIHGFDGLSNVMPLYVGAAGWTVVYDTLYAHQDKADDAKLGLKSTALLMGEHTSTVLSTVSLASVTAFAISGYMLDMAWPYYVGVAGSAAHMLWQVRTADYNDRESLTRRFVRNKWVGWIMLAGIVGGQLL